MTITSSRSLIFEVKSTASELAFIRGLRLRETSEVFGLLRKTLGFFGDLRKWSCRVQNSQHCQDKNLTLISRKSWQVYVNCILLLVINLWIYGTGAVTQRGLYRDLFNQNSMDFVTEISFRKSPVADVWKNVDFSNRQGLRCQLGKSFKVSVLKLRRRTHS